MTKTEFFERNGTFVGFSIRQHTGAAPEGEDIVCAAVSSAAYMTVNTITDVLLAKAHAEADEDEAELRIMILPESVELCRAVMEGFHLHILALEEQYPMNIQVIRTEV